MSDATMSALAFKRWKNRMEFSSNDAAKALGKSQRMVFKYLAGDTPIPDHVAKMCAMLERERKREAA